MILTDNNLRLNEIIGDTYFFIYRVNNIFGSKEQVIHLKLSAGDLRGLLKYKGE